MHMISKKDLNAAEIDNLTKSCSPTIVIIVNGEVQTYEEHTVHVKELDILLTMKVLENTSAVLSLTGNFVPIVAPDLQLLQQNAELREAHHESLNEMQELKSLSVPLSTLLQDED